MIHNLMFMLISVFSKGSISRLFSSSTPDIGDKKEKKEAPVAGGNTFESKTFVLSADGTDITGSDAGITLINPGTNPTLRITTAKKLKLANVDSYGIQKTLSLNYGDILPFVQYKALLSQLGTDAPIATILENTIGDIVLTRDSEGNYLGTAIGKFLDKKTTFLVGQGNPSLQRGVFFQHNNIPDDFSIETGLLDGTHEDNVLFKTLVEIRVYKGWKYFISAINDTNFDLTFEMQGDSASDLTGKLQLIEG